MNVQGMRDVSWFTVTALAVLVLSVTGCHPEDALRATGADMRGVQAYYDQFFDDDPAPEEFAAVMRKLASCPAVRSLEHTPTTSTNLVLTERHKRIPGGMRTVRAAIDLPNNMRPFTPLSHDNAAWWQAPTGEYVAFIGGTGQGYWTMSDARSYGVGGTEACWNQLAGHVGYRKDYYLPHESGIGRVYVATGTVVLRREAAVVWFISARSRAGIERMLPIVHTLRAY